MSDRAVPVTISLYPHEIEALDRYAHSKSINRSEAVRHLVERAGLKGVQTPSVPGHKHVWKDDGTCKHCGITEQGSEH